MLTHRILARPTAIDMSKLHRPSDNSAPEQPPSSFKDRLAQWNVRDSKTDPTALDIVRLGRSNDFIRLGAKKRYSITRNDSGGQLGNRRSSLGKNNSGSTPKDQIAETAPFSPVLMKKIHTPVTIKKSYQSRKSASSSTEKKLPDLPITASPSKSEKSSGLRSSRVISEDKVEKNLHPLQANRQRLRKHKDGQRLKTRTKSVRAKPLLELKKEFTAPVIEKNAAVQKVLRAALKKNFVFESLTPAAADQLVDAFEPTDPYKKGDCIIKQGDEGDYFYVIESGEVSFEVNDHAVGSAKTGDSFGELALLYTCPRAATVKAATTTKVWRLEQTVFRYVLQSKARESKATKYNLLKKIDFFQRMEESDVKQCVNVMTPRKYEAGEYIVRKGEDGDAFYVVESGELNVTDISVEETTYEDVTLGPGDFFGERALVKSEPRAANVIGVKPGTLFSIDRNTFERVCGSFVRLILKSQDKSRLSGLKVIKAAKLDADTVNELSQFLGDEMYRQGKEIWVEGKKAKPALYMVREGRIQIRYASGLEKIIKEGGFFGEDTLLADVKGTIGGDGRIVAKYSATALDHNSICGVLTLSDCRKVFDTKNIELSGELEDEDFAGMVVDDDEEFRTMVGRRTSKRASVNMNSLRTSLIRESVLGEGQFGEVWEVSSTMAEFSDKEKFALKIQSKHDTSRSDYSAIEAIRRECEVLASVDHPFIVDLVHHYEDEDSIYMVMGLIKGGDLWAVIHRELDDGEWYSGIPEDHAKFYCLIVADTLDYLHRRKIAFRDLKPENVMVDEEGYPIIVDFGFAKILKDGVTYTFCGTPQYLAPEITTNQGHGFAVDHWALGVVIYEMIAGESPFWYEGIDNMTLFNDICKETPYPIPEDRSPSAEVQDLIDRLLTKDPTQRIGSLAKGGREIKMHPWFADLDLQLAREKKLKAPFLPSSDKT